MKKKLMIITMLVICAGVGVTGCRSRITASSDADEIRNAEDALADANNNEEAGKWIKNSMSKPEDTDSKDESEKKNETEEQKETESELETQEETKPENESESAPEVTTEAQEKDEIPEVTTAPPETAPDVPEITQSNEEHKDEADKEYSKDDRKSGEDLINTNSDNKTDKGEGKASGNGGEGGEGGTGNGGASPGISLTDPTEPPVTVPAEPEEAPEPPNENKEPPTEDEPPAEIPEIYVNVTFDSADGEISGGNARELKVGEQYGELPVCSRGGYTFAGWFTGENGSGIRIDAGSVVSIEEDHTLYAFYAQREIHNVHFVTEGVRGNYWLGNSSYENRQIYVGDTYGEAFPVPHTRSGYTFLGWFDAPEGGNYVSNTDIFLANTDIELFAHMDYDPLSYWIGILNNINGYPCQNLGTICEYDTPDVPVVNSLFVARLGKGPVQAADASTAGMTTEEILKAKPNTRVMIKIISDINNADAVAGETLNRYPVEYPYNNRALYIIPAEAETGEPAVTLVYNLAIKMSLWPESFENNQALNPWGLDALNKAVEELGVPYPTIIHYGY